MILFKEKTHQYFKGDTPYIGTTTLISKYKNEFDADFWSTYKALERILGKNKFDEMKKYKDYKSPAFIEWCCSFVEDPDELIQVIAEIKKEWDHEKDKSILKGTTYHEQKEKQAISNGFEINPFTRNQVTTIPSEVILGDKTGLSDNLFELVDGYYPELLLWNHEYEIAGTADKVFITTIGKNRFVDIDDFKTNKVIKKSNHYEKMKKPLDGLDDCNYNHYRLQISLYAWMMEQFGYTVRYTAFTHMNTPYKIVYTIAKKYLEDMLNHYNKTKNEKSHQVLL